MPVYQRDYRCAALEIFRAVFSKIPKIRGTARVRLWPTRKLSTATVVWFWVASFSLSLFFSAAWTGWQATATIVALAWSAWILIESRAPSERAEDLGPRVALHNGPFSSGCVGANGFGISRAGVAIRVAVVCAIKLETLANLAAVAQTVLVVPAVIVGFWQLFAATRPYVLVRADPTTAPGTLYIELVNTGSTTAFDVSLRGPADLRTGLFPDETEYLKRFVDMEVPQLGPHERITTVLDVGVAREECVTDLPSEYTFATRYYRSKHRWRKRYSNTSTIDPSVYNALVYLSKKD